MGRDVALNENGLRIGETHPRSTISDDTVYQIRTLHEENKKSYGQLAMKFKLPVCTISKLCRYERRAQIPDRWKRIST